MSNSADTTEDRLNGAGSLTGFRIGGAIDSALRLRPLSSVDDYATKALAKTVDWIFNDPKVRVVDPSTKAVRYEPKTVKEGETTKTLISLWTKFKNEFNNNEKSRNSTDRIGDNELPKDQLVKKIAVERVDAVTKRLDVSSIDDITRLLLSNSDIYAFMLLQSIQSVKEDDTAGLEKAVLLRVSDLPKRCFYADLLTEVTQDQEILVAETEKNKIWSRLADLTLEKSINIRAQQVKPSVKALLDQVYREGNLPYYLDKFVEFQVKKGVFSSTTFTPAIKQAMIDQLLKMGVRLDSATETDIKEGTYDKYFLVAYNEALRMSTTADDPIDQARFKGGEVQWNFAVDSFESVYYQGVIPNNIKAAGALDYIYTIGERMRVFDVANALVLRWASGMLDVPEGKTAAMLYRFHKLRNERNTPEERAMLYKRVLNKGDGKLLSTMVVNQAFPQLWHQFMEEVVTYIRKSERSKDVWVSKSPIFEATKNLQGNLTEYMTGMSHVQVAEDYAHLQEALDILRADEVLNSFGGRRKSLWSVIEQVAKEDLKTTVQTATLRTIAVEGNKVFQWIAGFESDRTASDNDFAVMLSAAESWIIAQAALESPNGTQSPQQPDPSQMPDFMNMNNMKMPDFNMGNMMNSMKMPNFGEEAAQGADW